MDRAAHDGGGRRGFPWRIISWGTAAPLLLLPLLAMQFTSEVNWTRGDFIFAAVVFGTIGIILELTMGMTSNLAYRAAVGAGLAAAFLLVWANGAVGMIGDEGNSYNLFFGLVLAAALAGAIGAGLEARGMMRAMLAAGIAQVLVAAGGLSMDLRGAIFSAALAGLWFVSAWLFRKAALSPSQAR